MYCLLAKLVLPTIHTILGSATAAAAAAAAQEEFGFHEIYCIVDWQGGSAPIHHSLTGS